MENQGNLPFEDLNYQAPFGHTQYFNTSTDIQNELRAVIALQNNDPGLRDRWNVLLARQNTDQKIDYTDFRFLSIRLRLLTQDPALKKEILIHFQETRKETYFNDRTEERSKFTGDFLQPVGAINIMKQQSLEMLQKIHLYSFLDHYLFRYIHPSTLEIKLVDSNIAKHLGAIEAKIDKFNQHIATYQTKQDLVTALQNIHGQRSTAKQQLQELS